MLGGQPTCPLARRNAITSRNDTALAAGGVERREAPHCAQESSASFPERAPTRQPCWSGTWASLSSRAQTWNAHPTYGHSKRRKGPDVRKRTTPGESLQRHAGPGQRGPNFRPEPIRVSAEGSGRSPGERWDLSIAHRYGSSEMSPYVPSRAKSNSAMFAKQSPPVIQLGVAPQTP